MSHKTIAIIAGTGLAGEFADQLQNRQEFRNCSIAFDDRRAQVLYYVKGTCYGVNVIVIPRHGPTRNVPDRSPSELVRSYGHEAHFFLLKQLNVSAVYAFNSVGAIDSSLPLAKDKYFLIPNQYARGIGGAPHSFGSAAIEVHPSMNQPFSPREREILIESTKAVGAIPICSGLYINSFGDCFESAPETEAYQLWYKNYENRVVGMTGAAEIQLAKQMKIPYAMICASCNWAEGLPEATPVNHNLVLEGMKPATELLNGIAKHIIQREAGLA